MPTNPVPAITTAHAAAAPSLWLLAAIAAAVALLGVALGRLSATRRLAPAAPVQPVMPVRPIAVTTPADSPALDQLAMACLHLADSVASPVLQADVDRALRAAGYQSLDPTGQPFDPSVHEAVERRDTTDARTHNVVAATYRAGWYRRGHLLRSPEVAVYRLEASK